MGSFDYWKELAERDPELFEKKRKEEIDRQIAKLSAGSKKRELSLKQLQFRIDGVRHRYKDPLVSMVKLNLLMRENGLTPLNDALSGNMPKTKPEKRRKANVLNFDLEKRKCKE